MPKVFQCIHCRKSIIGGTYTLIKHVEECRRKQRQLP